MEKQNNAHDFESYVMNTVHLVFLLPIALVALVQRLWGARKVLGNSLPCPTCSTQIPLTGMWRCKKCNFVFYGFFFAQCKVCRGIPLFINCPACGASTRNPLIVWWWRREQRG